MRAVSLSQTERQSLLALQGTASLLQATQQRLATGKRVNTALDNPTNYFSSQALNQRAGDLQALLDQIDQSQQTLRATDNGIAALVKLVQSAKAVAEQARSAPDTNASYNNWNPFEGTANITPQAATTVTGSSTGATVSAGGMVIRVGGVRYTVVSSGAKDFNQIVTDINNSPGLGLGGAATASRDPSGHLVLTSNSPATITVDWSTQAMNTGLFNPNLVQVLPSLSGQALTVQADTGTPATINFGNGPGEVATFGDLLTALNGTGTGASISSSRHLQLYNANSTGSSSLQSSLTIGGTALGSLGLSAGTNQGLLAGGTVSATRDQLAQQYDDLLGQINLLAQDSSYNGINLLAGGSLPVTLNETGTSTLTIAGANSGATGLGLTAVGSAGFQTAANITVHINALTSALDTLRQQSSLFGSSLAIVQTRQDFTKQAISLLRKGSDDLTLADTNAEAASALALETRQQLSMTALSLAAQSSQSVLRLFR
jgi:flagellin